MLRWLRNSTKLLESNFVSCLPLLGVYSFIRLFNSKVLSTLLRSFSLLAAPLSSTQCSLSAESLWSVVRRLVEPGRKTLSELWVDWGRRALGESVWIPADPSFGPSAPARVHPSCDCETQLWSCQGCITRQYPALWSSFYPSSPITWSKSSGNPPHKPRHMHRFVRPRGKSAGLQLTMTIEGGGSCHLSSLLSSFAKTKPSEIVTLWD